MLCYEINKTTSAESLENIYNQIQSIDQYFKNIYEAQIAKQWNTPVYILQKLSYSNYEDTIVNLVRNKNTPVEYLYRHFDTKSTYDKIKCNIAYNGSCPIDLLDKLSNDENYNVRCCVAGNRNTPSFILMKLVRDVSISVREHLTNHPNTTDEMFFILALDEHFGVRQKLAKNDKVPREAILTNLPNFKKEWHNSKHYQKMFEVYSELF